LTVRLRLALLYGLLFLAAGALLLAITYALVALQPLGVQPSAPSGLPSLSVPVVQPLETQLREQRAAELNQLLVESGLALAIMGLVSMALGWLVAGRVLRPLQQVTARVRQISDANLHERLAFHGPDDELQELADTFDGLLGRLDAAFEAQRHFVAHASHELRTPLALGRTILEVALADPAASQDSLRQSCERALVAGEQQERLIEALLTLARGQRGLDRREPFDLASVTGDVLLAAQGRPAGADLAIRSQLDPATMAGDRRLIERLVTNLLDNASRYNVRGGWIRVSTGVDAEHSVLRVVNSGPVVQAEQVAALFEPFRRAGDARDSQGAGLGLGLSIVSAIATAHGAHVRSRPGPEGGLDIEVRFP
jgi:signal transduction histidine kinase